MDFIVRRGPELQFKQRDEFVAEAYAIQGERFAYQDDNMPSAPYSPKEDGRQ
jgi:hypothetical protein